MLSSLEDFSLKAYTKNYDQICCARDIGKWFLDCYNTYTVNVVIFAGGKFRENVGKTFPVGVIFTILLLFPS